MKIRELFVRADLCDGCGKCINDYPQFFDMAEIDTVPSVIITPPLNDQQEVEAGNAIEKCGTLVKDGGYGGRAAIWGRGEGEMPGVRQ